MKYIYCTFFTSWEYGELVLRLNDATLHCFELAIVITGQLFGFTVSHEDITRKE